MISYNPLQIVQMSADTTHQVFKHFQPANDRIKVWRYMDLPRFIGLLQSKSLYLARADTLEDPFEGHGTQMNRLRDEATIAEVLSYPDSNQAAGDSLRRLFRNSVQTLRQSMYVSCWCSGDTEKDTMWKAYGGDGVVVQSTYDKLRENLPGIGPNHERSTYIGCVRYLDYHGSDWIPQGYVFFPFIHKRKEFEEEKEVRIIYFGLGQQIEDSGISIPIEISKVIDDVRIYPGAPVWIREILTNIIRKYGLELDVSASRLDTIPVL